MEPQIATITHAAMMNCSYSSPLYPYCHTTPTNSFLPSMSFLTTKKIINKQHTNTDPTMIHIFVSLHMFLFSYKNLLRYESCPYLIKFPWQYESNALHNVISSTPLTPFATHIDYLPFPVSHDLSSGNDLGFHTIELLLTFDSWFLFLQRCNLNTYFH